MVKRFLLNQKIHRRNGGTVLRAPRAAGIAFAARVKRFALLVSGRKVFPLTIMGFAALCTALVFYLSISGPPDGTARQEEVSEVTANGAPTDVSAALKGSGVPLINRNQDIEHIVADGETFSEIAYVYNVNIEKLALYNRIADVNRIKEGTVIKIPSLNAEQRLVSKASFKAGKVPVAGNPAKKSLSRVPLRIEAEQQFDGMAVTAHFAVKTPPEAGITRFEWDLGNGRKSFRPTTFWTYDVPGTYTVKLKAIDADGREYSADEVFVDVPHPTTFKNTSQEFLTLESLDQTFTVYGKIVEVIHYDDRPEAPIEEVAGNEGGMSYRAVRPGYFGLEVESDGARRRVYVFASPVDSRHSDRPDMNWYRTQFNTGTQSNCGPAVAAMAISWATGDYMAVSAVRQEIGWTGNGSTSFEDLIGIMGTHRVTARLVKTASVRDLFDIIDRGNIAAVLYNSGGPRLAKGHPGRDLFGRYYHDAVGHYAIVKGYSKDGNYLVVYDPIPSDWGANSFRYADGISMIGRNRYYGAKEMYRSLRRADVIEIMRRTEP